MHDFLIPPAPQQLSQLNSELNASLLAKISSFTPPKSQLIIGDIIKASFSASKEKASQISALAKELMPWRKGPFMLGELFIDSEWQSFMKFNLLAPHLDLKGKIVADVGCNNGYYMYKMLEFAPAKIVGFDPGVRPFLQFCFLERFFQSGIGFELAGVEQLGQYPHKFDSIFCLGVLYHRSDPIATLKQLKAALNPNGEVILDTLYLSGEDELVLSPKASYAKMSNVYFIPSISALMGWCERAKFKDVKLLATSKTEPNEQRKSQWIAGESLENFLNPLDSSLTIEGYPAPQRAYLRLKI